MHVRHTAAAIGVLLATSGAIVAGHAGRQAAVSCAELATLSLPERHDHRRAGGARGPVHAAGQLSSADCAGVLPDRRGGHAIRRFAHRH